MEYPETELVEWNAAERRMTQALELQAEGRTRNTPPEIVVQAPYSVALAYFGAVQHAENAADGDVNLVRAMHMALGVATGAAALELQKWVPTPDPDRPFGSMTPRRLHVNTLARAHDAADGDVPALHAHLSVEPFQARRDGTGRCPIDRGELLHSGTDAQNRFSEVLREQLGGLGFSIITRVPAWASACQWEIEELADAAAEMPPHMPPCAPILRVPQQSVPLGLAQLVG